ncbi:MAG: S-methyl-5-thioribose kinase, partial [Geminicoccaceae bacterium]|nr:S-methyl-5-thioribose kinase [Geminicoccaceae bacterium]
MEEGNMAIETPPGYRPLSEATLCDYLATLAEIGARLGGSPGDWRVSEVGDGNLNLVFIVEGPAGDICVKQALPYVRLVGESWPLPLDRAFFEHRASVIQ